MKISARQLTRFCPATPADPLTLKNLLDDLGLEIKRMEASQAVPEAVGVSGDVIVAMKESCWR